MDFNELLQILWRRKLSVLITAVLVVAAAVASLQLTTPAYQASSTLVLTPTKEELNLYLALPAIVPIYAKATTSITTRRAAEARLGGDLAEKISVVISDETPIIEVRARDPDPELAARSAQAVTEVLRDRVASGNLGLRSLRLDQIERPSIPTEPVFPRTNLTLAVAVLLGLGFGIGIALVRESLTSRVETADELAEVSGIPIYAEIPMNRKLNRLRSPDDLVDDVQFRILAEAMRDLRTNLHFSENGFKSVVVTSPQGSHGKTTIAFGLAAALANAGTRTLLVDGDMRRGRVAEMLRIPRAPGLWDALTGMEISRTIQRTSLETLQVMPAGTLGVNSGGEVLATHFASVLERLEKTYDVIVIDSTPLVPVNDARIMASAAQTTLIVASAESTKRRHVRDAIARLSLVSVRPTAFVLNRSREDRSVDRYYGPDK